MKPRNDNTAPIIAVPPDAQACFRDLLDKVNLIALTLDPDARLTYCNEYFLKLTGWSFKEIEGCNFYELFVPPSIEDLKPLLADLFRDIPDTWHHENDIFTRSGERRTIRWNNILLRDALGHPVAAGSIGEDITDRRILERALNDGHARERGDLEKQLHDGLGQELAGIALLARSLATSAGRDRLDIAEDLARLSVIASNAIESCRRIARGLAPFSEVQGGLVHAIKQLTVPPVDGRGPSLEFSVSQTAPVALQAEACDHVYHVAQEAVANAMHHSGASSVKVALQIHSAYISVEISDDGAGFAAGGDGTAGLDLRMMQHRAVLLQASLRIEPCGVSGTRLLLTCAQPAGRD
jgi:PAS domain S-box-containing protein